MPCKPRQCLTLTLNFDKKGCRRRIAGIHSWSHFSGGGILARADNPDAPVTEVVTVEGNIYFPLKAVSRDCLHASSHTSVCPWKGTAHYYDMVVAGNINKNAA